MTPLDGDAPANRDAIDEAIALCERRLTPLWLVGLAALACVAVLVGSVAATRSLAAAQIAYVVGILAVAYLAQRLIELRMSPPWRRALALHRAASGQAALSRRWLRSVTLATALVCVAFAAGSAWLGVDALALSRAQLTTEPWRLFTSMVTHAGAAHLAGTLLALLALGFPVELRIGRRATVGLLLASGAIAALA